eukprot:scaffold58110_cov33-Tisochrysis_lutea.AAC.1
MECGGGPQQTPLTPTLGRMGHVCGGKMAGDRNGRTLRTSKVEGTKGNLKCRQAAPSSWLQTMVTRYIGV